MDDRERATIWGTVDRTVQMSTIPHYIQPTVWTAPLPKPTVPEYTSEVETTVQDDTIVGRFRVFVPVDFDDSVKIGGIVATYKRRKTIKNKSERLFEQGFDRLDDPALWEHVKDMQIVCNELAYIERDHRITKSQPYGCKMPKHMVMILDGNRRVSSMSNYNELLTEDEKMLHLN